MRVLLPITSRTGKPTYLNASAYLSYLIIFIYDVQAGRPKKRFLFGHLFLNITNVFCAKKRVGHACICPRMVTGASFEVIPPPKKLVFPRPKKWKFPTENCLCFPDPIFFWKFWRFTVFAAKILSRRSRLSRWSRAPSRLIRPLPIDCDRGPKQRVNIFPVFGFELCQKKVFSEGPRSNPDLHPKRSP